MRSQSDNLDIFQDMEEPQETEEIRFILDQATNESAPARTCQSCADEFFCANHTYGLDACRDYVELAPECSTCLRYAAWEETGTAQEYPCVACKFYKGSKRSVKP